MKTNLFLLLSLLCFSSRLHAQAPEDTVATPVSRFYVGLELSSISYLMANYETQVGGMFTPIVHVNAGYRLSKRANLQLGLTYDRERDNFESVYYKSADSTIYRSFQTDYRGMAIPLTLQYTPFNPNRRLNFFATASLVTVLGKVHQRQTAMLDRETEILFDAYESGVYALATAGLLLNYRLSRHLEGYAKANLLYKDPGHYSDYAKKAKSLGIGLNYNF